MKALARLLMLLALLAPTFASAQTASSAPIPSCTLSASASTVPYNTKVQLTWTSANAQSGYLDSAGPIPAQGYSYVVPGKTTTYSASFTGAGGSVVCRVVVVVSASGAGANGTGTTGNGGGSGAATNGDTSGNTSGTTGDTSGNSGSTVNTNGSINTTNPTNTNGSTIDTNTTPANNATSPTLPTAPPLAPTPAASTPSSGLFGGIVPAECQSNANANHTIQNCDFCSLGQLVQNIANFLLGLTIPAAALLFAWAGILFFSSRGSPDQINRAKKIFMSVVIGFVIAIAAWTLVNTVMQMLVHGTDFAGWHWNSLNCADTRKARLYNLNLSDYLRSSLPGLSSAPTNIVPGTTLTGSANGTTCADGSAPSVTPEGNFCNTPSGLVPAGPSPSGSSAYSCDPGYSLGNNNGVVSCNQKDANGNVTTLNPQCTSGASPNNDGQCTDINGNVVLPPPTGGSNQTMTVTLQNGTQQTYTCPDCAAIPSDIPGFNRNLTCSQQIDGACQASIGMIQGLEQIKSNLPSDFNWQVSEAWPPTVYHASGDQNAGNSVDLSACNTNTGYSDANSVASCIQTMANAAQSAGKRVDYECNSPSAVSAVSSALQQNGVSPSSINTKIIYVSYASGAGAFPCHFSLY